MPINKDQQQQVANVRFSDDDSATEAAASSTTPPQPQPRRRLQRPFTAAAASSVGAPFLDASGQRTQPSRDEQLGLTSKLPPSTTTTTQNGRKKKKKKRRRPKTAPGLAAAETSAAAARTPAVSSAGGGGGGGGSEPNFPALNPRVFHALRGFLTPESLRKTKFYSDREDRMCARRQQLDAQQSRLSDRIGGFYERLDSFIAETNAAALWEPEEKRKQKGVLDDL